jgi:hypothetical protein
MGRSDVFRISTIEIVWMPAIKLIQVEFFNSRFVSNIKALMRTKCT